MTVPIEADETGGSLHDKLSAAGAKLIISTLEGLKEGTLTPVPQTDEGTCYAKMLTKSLGDIDWNASAEAIERLIRGLNPWPSAYTCWNGKTLKIWSAEVVDWEKDAKAGEVVACDAGQLIVKAGEKALRIKELQLEGKKRMDTASFLRGYAVELSLIHILYSSAETRLK